MASAALLLPFGKDVSFSPVLAWFLIAMNMAIIIGAIAVLLTRRRSPRGGRAAEAPAPANTAQRPNPVPVTKRGPARAPAPPAPPARPAPDPDQEIVARLSNPDPFLRMSAVAALRGRRDCEGLLVRALNDRYPMVRREVVRALRTTGSSYATEVLIKVAAHDPSAEVREEAVAALGALLREAKPEEESR